MDNVSTDTETTESTETVAAPEETAEETVGAEETEPTPRQAAEDAIDKALEGCKEDGSYEDPADDDEEDETEGVEEDDAGKTPEPAAPKEEDKIPAAVTDRAKALGFSEDDIGAFPTEQALTRALDAVDAKFRQLQTPPEETPAVVEETPSDTLTLDETTFDLIWTDPDDPSKSIEGDVDPTFLANMQRQAQGAKLLHAELEKVKSELAEMQDVRQHVQEVRTRENVLRMDKLFDGLDADYKAFLGDGPFDSLGPDSEELARRMAVVEDMGALMAKGRDINEAFSKAVRGLLADDVMAQKGKTIEKKVKRRQGQFLARSTKSGTPDALLSGREKVEAAIEAKLAEIAKSG